MVNKIFKSVISLVLCLIFLCSGVPVTSDPACKDVTFLYDTLALRNDYMLQGLTLKESNPEGMMIFPVVKAELEMDNLYAIEIYRMGGTEGACSVTVESIDYTALYGIDYEIYLSNGLYEPPIEGKAAPIYAIENYSFVPQINNTKKQYVDENNSANDSFEYYSQYVSQFHDLITPSSSFTLDFAEGENSKMIFIQTYMDETITDNLEFTLSLVSSDGADISSQNSMSFTIKESREKPETKIMLVDTVISPDSSEGYIKVARGGNLGSFCSYRVVSQSDTAIAGEDYEPVQMQLDFLPGMTEQKIPFRVLDGAEDGEQIVFLLENVTNATALNERATVTFSDEEQAINVKAGTYLSNITIDSEIRGKEFVSAKDFEVDTYTDRGTLTKGHWYNVYDDHAVLGFSNGGSSKNNAVAIRTKEKINFSGVNNISFVIDNYSGSCKWDHNAIYVADESKYNKNTGDYDFIDTFDDEGACIGDSWDMINVGDDHIVRTTPILTQSSVGGEHYLYILLHKGDFAGTAEFKIFSECSKNDASGTSTDNIILHLTEYTLKVSEPDSVLMHIDGTNRNVTVASNFSLSDPATGSFNSSCKIYRNETTVLNYTNTGIADLKLRGFVFTKGSETSELIPVTGNSSFTLTADLLHKYSKFIGTDNVINIKPVFEVEESKADVCSYDYTIGGKGQKFTVTGENEGQLSYNGNNVGVIKWSAPANSNGYYIGEEIDFEFVPADNYKNYSFNISVEYYSGSTENEASGSGSIKVDKIASGLKETISITDNVVKIYPRISVCDFGTELYVENPDKGDFSGKNSEFMHKETNGNAVNKSAVYVTGYELADGRTVQFNDMAPGSVLTFFAKPIDGYRAKWTYINTFTGEKNIYYGNSFSYYVQNVIDKSANCVTLTFEDVNGKASDYYLSGMVSIQEGTIINPPSLNSSKYEPMPYAVVTIGDYVGVSDEKGAFYLVENVEDESKEKAKLSLCGDEIIRALILSNNQYYIADFDVSKYISTAENNEIVIDLKTEYVNAGPSPESISAYGNGTQYLGDIPLVTGSPVRFELKLNLSQEDPQRPINMVKWTIEDDEGAVKAEEFVELEEGTSYSSFATMIAEVARPGAKMWVELIHVPDGVENAENYVTFGRFETGYEFIALSVEESVTYSPDVGVTSDMVIPAPCIGPFSPMVSFYGLQPVFNVGGGQVDENGRQMKQVVIGVGFNTVKLDAMNKDSSFTTLSPLDKGKKLLATLESYDECYNKTNKLPKFASPEGMKNALNLKTTVNVSLTVALSFQGNYYVDSNTGEWMFVSTIYAIGFGGTLSLNIPFTFFYIPCFTNIAVTLKTGIFLNVTPTKTDPVTGEILPLKLTELWDPDLSKMEGAYRIEGNITFGLGVGFNGLVSAQGQLGTTIDVQFNDFMRGKGNLVMSGSVMVEFLFLKYSWGGEFVDVELFNNYEDNPNEPIAAAYYRSTQENILKSVKLKDMEVSIVNEEYVDLLRAAHNGSEVVVSDSEALVNPSITSLEDGKYMILSVIADENSGESEGAEKTQKLYYLIYDEKTNSVIEEGFVIDKMISDVVSRGRSLSFDEIRDTYDNDVQVIDCGEDLIITWTKLQKGIHESEDNLDILKSIGIASIKYNKETGRFYNYKYIHSEEDNTIYIHPKTVYNSQTGLTQLFYEKMNLTGVTVDSTISELQNTPTTLAMRVLDNEKEEIAWSDEKEIAISDSSLKYFDVASIGNRNVLSFVGAPNAGFILEDASEFDIDEEQIDSNLYNTKTSLYIQQFYIENNEVKSSNQVELSSNDSVIANPTFATVKSGNIANLLLFFKLDGSYVYYNINNLIAHALYKDARGDYHFNKEKMAELYISEENDRSVNDDFMVISNEENIFALWTKTEGDQQQIMVRSFTINDIIEYNESPVYDVDGNVKYDEAGNVMLEPLDNPRYVLKGDWGGATYLTEGGINGSDSGKSKRKFDAVVTASGDLLVIYNAFDMDCKEEYVGIRNNRVVMSTFDTATEYVAEDSFGEIMFSNKYPICGETVEVESIITNKGILNGENVVATLYANGEKYSSIAYDKWLCEESKSVTFNYEVPFGVNPDEIELYIEISENDEVKFKTDKKSFEKNSKLEIINVELIPVKKPSESDGNAAYRVVAQIKNAGNEDYTSGKYIRLAQLDWANLANAINDEKLKDEVVYTMYGTSEIDSVKIGDSTIISFISRDIPESAFENYANEKVAHFDCIITDSTQLSKNTFKADEEILILNDYSIGATLAPADKYINALTVYDMNISVGESNHLEIETMPKDAVKDSKITYTSSDESVAIVNSLGIVTGVGAGKCTITATSENGVSGICVVNVTKAPSDNSKPEQNLPNDDNSNTGDDTTFVLLFAFVIISVTTVSRRKSKND